MSFIETHIDEKEKKLQNVNNEKIKKVSKRISFEIGIYENLQLVAGAKGISVSDYVNDILREQFKEINNNTTYAELKKIGEIKSQNEISSLNEQKINQLISQKIELQFEEILNKKSNDDDFESISEETEGLSMNESDDQLVIPEYQRQYDWIDEHKLDKKISEQMQDGFNITSNED